MNRNVIALSLFVVLAGVFAESSAFILFGLILLVLGAVAPQRRRAAPQTVKRAPQQRPAAHAAPLPEAHPPPVVMQDIVLPTAPAQPSGFSPALFPSPMFPASGPSQSFPAEAKEKAEPRDELLEVGAIAALLRLLSG
jgi:hypothetical protein